MHDLDHRSRLEEQTNEVKWDNVKIPDSEYGESDNNQHRNESEDGSNDGELVRGAYYEML